MTSLTLVRRIPARPTIVFDALASPEGIRAWWGPDAGPVIVAESDSVLPGPRGNVERYPPVDTDDIGAGFTHQRQQLTSAYAEMNSRYT